jgi:hypothetical protein
MVTPLVLRIGREGKDGSSVWPAVEIWKRSCYRDPQCLGVLGVIVRLIDVVTMMGREGVLYLIA